MIDIASCHCCGTTQNLRFPVSESLTGSKSAVCNDCLYVWYETGNIDPQKIRELSLQRQSNRK